MEDNTPTPPDDWSEELNEERFLAAKAQAEEVDGRVCGTLLPSGEPVYFVMPDDADEWDVQERAFEIRNGRPMSKLERKIIAVMHMSTDDVADMLETQEAEVADALS